MNDQERYDVVKHRMERANDTLNEINVLLQNQFYNNAVNRLYYACFYAVSALLVSKEIQSKTHSGTKQMFGLHFVKPGIISEGAGDFYTEMFDLRQTAEYDDYIVFEKEEIYALLPVARKLIEEIEQIITQWNN